MVIMMLGASDAVLGLDLSLTGTGVCLLSENNHIIKSIKTKPVDGKKMDRYVKILCGIREVTKEHAPLAIFIENYAFGVNPKNTSSIVNLGELGGIIKYSFRAYPIFLVAPNTLKLFVTGKGNSKKEDMKLKSYKKYNREFKTNDECDAFGLADLGGAVLDLWPERTYFSYELRAIETVEKGNEEVFQNGKIILPKGD